MYQRYPYRTIKSTLFDEEPEMKVVLCVVDVDVFGQEHNGRRQIV